MLKPERGDGMAREFEAGWGKRRRGWRLKNGGKGRKKTRRNPGGKKLAQDAVGESYPGQKFYHANNRNIRKAEEAAEEISRTVFPMGAGGRVVVESTAPLDALLGPYLVGVIKLRSTLMMREVERPGAESLFAMVRPGLDASFRNYRRGWEKAFGLLK